MKPQRKYRLGRASNNYWGGGVKPVLRATNLIFRYGINLNNKKKNKSIRDALKH